MRDYDGKQSADGFGRSKGKGMKGGSLMGEFFPPNVRDHVMRPPSEIGRFKYPDTEEAIFKEQEGNVRIADRDRASGMHRK